MWDFHLFWNDCGIKFIFKLNVGFVYYKSIQLHIFPISYMNTYIL